MILQLLSLVVLFISISMQHQQYSCISGYKWYNLYTQCIPNSPVCNIGYIWNSKNCLPAVYCANSTYYDGSNCVDGNNGCPNNFIRWRTFCLNCPKGFDLNQNDQTCFFITDTCSSNYYWNGVSCVSKISGLNINNQFDTSSNNKHSISSINGIIKTDISTNNFSTQTLNCSIGYYWNGANCIINNGSKNCILGYYWNRTHCSPTNSISTNCSQGYYFNGASCVINDGKIICLHDFSWNGFLCKINQSLNISENITTTQIQCPPGFVLNNNSCVSSYSNNLIKTIQDCQKEQYFNGLMCIKISQGISCIQKFTWNGNHCINISQIISHYKDITPIHTSNNKMVCKLDQFKNGQQCLKISQHPIKSINEIPQKNNNIIDIYCQKDYYYNGQSCQHVSSGINCLTNFYFDGTSCIRLTTTTQQKKNNITNCDNGYYFTGTNCQPSTIIQTYTHTQKFDIPMNDFSLFVPPIQVVNFPIIIQPIQRDQTESVFINYNTKPINHLSNSIQIPVLPIDFPIFNSNIIIHEVLSTNNDFQKQLNANKNNQDVEANQSFDGVLKNPLNCLQNYYWNGFRCIAFAV